MRIVGMRPLPVTARDFTDARGIDAVWLQSAHAVSYLEEQRDRAVVDELDVHVGAEDAALRAEPLADASVERLCDLARRGGDPARAVARARVAVERELADAQHRAVGAQRLVHPTVGVGEDPQG